MPDRKVRWNIVCERTDPGLKRESSESSDEGGPSPRIGGSAGVQVGFGNTQVNYFYGNPTGAESSDTRFAPASGTVGHPYRGHAFMSYVREDSGEVDLLQRTLEAAGIRVWRDTADLWPGENWRAKIRDAITSDALVFIACFSSHSAARRKSYQNEELLVAIEELRLRRPNDPWLIPVRLDDCDIPAFELGAGRTLASIQQVDAFGPSRDLAVRRLVAAVQRLLQ
jgi:TIR domain